MLYCYEFPFTTDKHPAHASVRVSCVDTAISAAFCGTSVRAVIEPSQVTKVLRELLSELSCLTIVVTSLPEPLLGSKDSLSTYEPLRFVFSEPSFNCHVPASPIRTVLYHDGKNLSIHTSSGLMVTYVAIDALVVEVLVLASLTEGIASADVDLRWKHRQRHCRSVTDEQLHSRITVLL